MGKITDRAEIKEYLESHPELLRESKGMKILDKPWFIPLIGFLITLGVLYGQFQIQEKDIYESKCMNKDQETRIVRIETVIPEVRDQQKEMNRKLDRLLERSSR